MGDTWAKRLFLHRIIVPCRIAWNRHSLSEEKTMDDAIRRILSSKRTRDAGMIGSVALLALVFVIDLNTPLGLAVCLGYAPAVLLATVTRSRIAVAAVAAVGLLLTLAGIFLSPPALARTPD